MALGCIADDFTGATDLANELQRQGLHTILFIGTPNQAVPLEAVDSVVIALKSRTAPVEQAVAVSLRALEWLRQRGAERIYLKYCSTFDSSDRGNIGPVADALLDALGESFTIASPAFPRNRRTVYKGHLFVGDVLLSESSMRHHPLTPMTDSNLVRVLGRQIQGTVVLIPHEVVRGGEAAIRGAFAAAREGGARFAIVDAVKDGDLLQIGRAAAELRLTTGASGIAHGLARALLRHRRSDEAGPPGKFPAVGGPAAVIAGSCSTATLDQIETMKAQSPCFAVDVLALAEGKDIVFEALTWAATLIASEPVLIYTSVPPDQLARIHGVLGSDWAGRIAENALAEISAGLVAAGVRRLIVAGGETAGSIVNALNVVGLRIGAEIDPGVPWTVSLHERPLALALKSGNFGAPDFFLKALEIAP